MSTFVQYSSSVVVLLAFSSIGRADGDDLTGTWYGPDGVTLSVRQVGNELWWVAKSGDGGKTFTSVFHGKLAGAHLIGQFADVPDGQNRIHGSLKAKLTLKDGKAATIDGELLFQDDEKPRPWSISRTKPEK